jgi:hypothetical protein
MAEGHLQNLKVPEIAAVALVVNTIGILEFGIMPSEFRTVYLLRQQQRSSIIRWSYGMVVV